LGRPRCRRLCTEKQRLAGLNYRCWKGCRKKNEEAIQIESSALTDEIRKKNEGVRSALVLQESEVGPLPPNLAYGSERSAAMSRKLALLEAEMQNTKKDFDGQIHELLVQLSEAQVRHEDVKAVFVGQLEQVKEEQELAVAEVKHSRSKSEIQKDVDQKFKVDGRFALGLLNSVLNPISEGIMFLNT
jgi:small-conductance mechanosensitive channel